ncbi:MAG: YIP1 family protein [Candidatus Micrarchaeia archaeon]|jgi:hypothetical protein
MVSAEKPGQIESAVLGVASAFPCKSFKAWISAYFRPASAIKESGSLGDAAKNIAIAGLLVGVVSGIMALVGMSLGGAAAGSMMKGGIGGLIGGGIGFAGGIVTLVALAVLTPIIYVVMGFVGSAIYFVVAKVLGGKGSYTSQTHILALVMCGTALLTLPFQVLETIPMVGGIFGLATMLIGLYAFYSEYRAIKEVHKLSQIRAIAVVITPIILGALVFMLAIMMFTIGYVASGPVMAY